MGNWAMGMYLESKYREIDNYPKTKFWCMRSRVSPGRSVLKIHFFI